MTTRTAKPRTRGRTTLGLALEQHEVAYLLAGTTTRRKAQPMTAQPAATIEPLPDVILAVTETMTPEARQRAETLLLANHQGWEIADYLGDAWDTDTYVSSTDPWWLMMDLAGIDPVGRVTTVTGVPAQYAKQLVALALNASVAFDGNRNPNVADVTTHATRAAMWALGVAYGRRPAGI